MVDDMSWAAGTPGDSIPTADFAPSAPVGFAGTSHIRPPDRGNYAAIDLGTNNCRLLIARPADDGFEVVDAFSRIVRLGEGMAATGRISNAAMDRAVAALSVCAGKLRRRRVRLARSVATEACRRAANGTEFAFRVYRETGIKLDIISAREEARLAVLGSYALLEKGQAPAIIFDIGGGSTELVLLETGSSVPRIVDWFSVPWGVVSLSEAMGGAAGGDGAAQIAAYARMRDTIRTALAGFAGRLPSPRDMRLLGTSGTVTTLASVHLNLPRYDRATVDGLLVPTRIIRDICQRLAGMTIAERTQIPCIGQERADLVVAGCAILESIMDIWPAERLGIADRGIREGILRSLMQDIARSPGR